MSGEKNEAGQAVIAAWNSHGPINLEAFKRSGLRMHKVYGMPDGSVHFLVNDYQAFQPLVLRGGEGKAFQRSLLTGQAARETVCSDMAFGNGKVAVVGLSYENNKYQVWSEVDGNRKQLELPYRDIMPLMGGAAWVTLKR